MNITNIDFAIDILSHPQSGDMSDIKIAIDIAIESLKICKELSRVSRESEDKECK